MLLLFPFSSLLWIFQLQPQVFPKFLFVLCCFEVSCLQGLLGSLRQPRLKGNPSYAHPAWKCTGCGRLLAAPNHSEKLWPIYFSTLQFGFLSLYPRGAVQPVWVTHRCPQSFWNHAHTGLDESCPLPEASCCLRHVLWGHTPTTILKGSAVELTSFTALSCCCNDSYAGDPGCSHYTHVLSGSFRLCCVFCFASLHLDSLRTITSGEPQDSHTETSEDVSLGLNFGHFMFSTNHCLSYLNVYL